jgi:hypothetical protein
MEKGQIVYQYSVLSFTQMLKRAEYALRSLAEKDNEACSRHEHRSVT